MTSPDGPGIAKCGGAVVPGYSMSAPSAVVAGFRKRVLVSKPQGWSRPPLAAERHQLTRSRIRRAAMEVVARRGFDATVAEIAEASGVSPRTVFRLYASHDQLILSTVKDMFEASGQPTEGVSTPTDDLDGWIEGLALTIHTRNAEILGEAFWDIHAPSRNASEALSEVDALRRGLEREGCATWRPWPGRGPVAPVSLRRI